MAITSTEKSSVDSPVSSVIQTPAVVQFKNVVVSVLSVAIVLLLLLVIFIVILICVMKRRNKKGFFFGFALQKLTHFFYFHRKKYHKSYSCWWYWLQRNEGNWLGKEHTVAYVIINISGKPWNVYVIHYMYTVMCMYVISAMLVRKVTIILSQKQYITYCGWSCVNWEFLHGLHVLYYWIMLNLLQRHVISYPLNTQFFIVSWHVTWPYVLVTWLYTHLVWWYLFFNWFA